MTERDADAGQGDEREPTLPADEEAAWAEIVAAYDEEAATPADRDSREPDGDTLTRSGDDAGDSDGSGDDSDDRSEGGAERAETGSGDGGTGEDGGEGHGGERENPPVRSVTVYKAGSGPRDWRAREDESEDHFVPPEPPPLPETDPTTRFAWIAALGGPLLLVGAVIVQADMTWWIMTLGVGGFLGGFATLVARMRDGRDDDDFDDPGRGAVV